MDENKPQYQSKHGIDQETCSVWHLVGWSEVCISLGKDPRDNKL